MNNSTRDYIIEQANPSVDTIINRINNRLSLRDPLRDSLQLVAYLAEELELKKEVDLKAELDKVKQRYPSCKDFERDFVSLCFSIATGVGKTRLMGAFITYLYLKKGIRNFFILAPNLTIYDKLIEDFGNPNYKKYVFKGISEFVTNRPVIINGDNYAEKGNLFGDQEVRINIFNISKFNSDNKVGRGKADKGKPPKMKRLSEYLGQSYWDYLAGLDDLVILMDEAHRYHADASKKAINELKPILGLELTATPLDEKGKAFKNVVYEYNLAQALEDGKYVKAPAIATRKDFDKKNLTPKEVEQFKLEDAISVHEDTKNELELYARNNDVPLVKPFILVVCKDINHASEVYNYISSNAFYNGKYEGRVLQIDSSTKKVEEIERQFLSLESPDNEIEIVIHVNMLKEGWDVTNLYTIVPLRAANASVLIEQTIGRGLRLPYNGRRTGVEKVDKLTVLAHDNFNRVIQEAKNPDSVLNKLTYIELDEEDLKTESTIVTSETKINAEIRREQAKINTVVNPEKKLELTHALEAKKAIVNAIPTFSSNEGVNSVNDLSKPEVKQKAIQKIKETLSRGQQNIFMPQIVAEAEAQYDSVVANFKSQIIEIPRMDLVLEEVETWFEDFDLDTNKGFDLNIMQEEILRMDLKDQTKIDSLGVKQGAFVNETPVNQVIAELINFPEIDYDESADLLHKLVTQALEKLSENLSDKEQLPVLIRQYRKVIAGKIYDQLKIHFKMSNPDYVPPTILPFIKIEDWNFTVPKENGYKHYTDVITPLSLVTKYVYRGFEKSCHPEYKFDSNTEKDFAFVIENDASVLKWLRPATNQFRIYWGKNSSKYEPDFIVETADSIFMCEPKKAKDVETEEVQLKMKAALKYCQYANDFTSKNEGKTWRYLLIPHDQVDKTSSFQNLVNRFERVS
ncbi:DEAD/DEAH box helicase [Winogradskyella wichelsiae]|uniref:DEAD/DEAH box helicase n=1 Tax=Winogradskyella wichelsiae TaxID=2697007 RepID=UPI0015CA0869|nr:DEAD/DEAH box helicase family protein [Winogradskyella wichelsiae]